MESLFIGGDADLFRFQGVVVIAWLAEINKTTSYTVLGGGWFLSEL